MTKKKHDKPLHLDVSFDEALKRLAQTDPRELPKPKTARKKKGQSARRRNRPLQPAAPE
jgi:hypothetical protein